MPAGGMSNTRSPAGAQEAKRFIAGGAPPNGFALMAKAESRIEAASAAFTFARCHAFRRIGCRSFLKCGPALPAIMDPSVEDVEEVKS